MSGGYKENQKDMKRMKTIQSSEYEIGVQADFYQLFYGVSKQDEADPEEDELSGQACAALWKCSFLLFVAAVGVILLFFI